MALFALEAIEQIKQYSISTGEILEVRIGIHVGPVMAGVIGKKKFAYDLWGDTVNIASRMESHGQPGKIHVSAEFKTILKNEFNFEPLPIMEIKGKGQMQTYFLEYPTNEIE